ncbi:MAG: mitochondrial fission protein ELM1 [Gammaproteobacteria bacterium]
MTIQDKPIIVWRIYDDLAGHYLQSLGLTQALSRLSPCQTYHIKAPTLTTTLIGLLTHNFTSAVALPDPDIIIGAGHATHLPIICAKIIRGGKSIVIMKPTFPPSWFDICLIPEHDTFKNRNNIVSIVGALTTIRSCAKKEAGKGLLMIGGPSKHYNWNEVTLIDQIKKICGTPTVKWFLTDSRRTPASTKKIFLDLSRENIIYKPHTNTSREWLEEQLQTSSTVWVTEDSVSMISEALSSGSGVGLLSIPVKKHGRISNAIKLLLKSNLVTSFAEWQSGQKLMSTNPAINESDRCANILLDRFFRRLRQK